MSTPAIWALLLTLTDEETARAAELPEWWTRWDDRHFLAPLGTPLPVFGTAENVQMDVAALPEKYARHDPEEGTR